MIRKQKEGRKAPLPGVSHGFRGAPRGRPGGRTALLGNVSSPPGPAPPRVERGEGLGLLVAPG